MKVCGFTFIRNAITLDFPIVEAITSVLPLCDHFVVAVGKSNDGTLETIQSIAPGKISVVETVWDETISKGGRVYAAETDKAFDAIPEEYDWCFYIQGDELIHEKHLPVVKKAMEDNLNKPKVEGLLFHYLHFFGSFDYVGNNRHWYRNEIRIIRNDKQIRSYKDAQGFRKNGQKLNVIPVQAEIFHYGWVRHPKSMQEKLDATLSYYTVQSENEANESTFVQEYNYSEEYDSVAPFTGTHPDVMKKRIERLNWDFKPDIEKINMKWKYRWLYRIEKWTGRRLFEYQNYNLLK